MARKLNKTEMVARVAQECDLSDGEALEAVDAVIEAIRSALVRGEEVRIAGFGVFEARTRSARVARNPSNGEMVRIPERRVVRFRPGKMFREIVNAEEGE